ncbi:hypothetical protein EV363DRAFT_1331611 [Boletus edulis]|nr:hypothetical protein EV363DRAFT_1331611 [Boletus edulis]
MCYDWERYGRRGVDVASAMTALAFSAVKGTTRLGFTLLRSVASSTVVATALAFDDTILGRRKVAAPVVKGAVSSAIDFAETLTLAPIYLGECISSASLRAAHSSIDILSIIFPGSSEASFSLGSFINLVKREWDNPTPSHVIPIKKYGFTDVARALIAWVALQGVTQEHHESQWSPYLRKVEVHSPTTGSQLKRVPSRIRVTSDLIFPGHRGQLISADIGEAPTTTHTRQRSASVLSRLSISSVTSSRWRDGRPEHYPKSTEEVKMNLRRFSKMVLAGYGGASLLFFGVSPMFASPAARAKVPTISNEKEAEEAQLEKAIHDAEAEMEGTSGTLPSSSEDNTEFSWWDILLGKHDKEIFERSVHVGRPDTQNVQSRMRATAVIGIERQMPRFWVLTDHDRCQVVLVLRGTMSLNELAVDLTCEPVEFEPASSSLSDDHDPDAKVPFPESGWCHSRRRSSYLSSPPQRPRYHVHGGMLRMARVMGEIGKPVHLAVMDALSRNPDYELILCGHSLGAGVAALLALMWADSTTCLTVSSSGLPIDRPVSVYCIAPPCLTDTDLGRLASKLIVSFVYSDDIVSRLSLGSVRDIRNAALWLCEANDNGGREGYSVVTHRTRQWKSGEGSSEDMHWFLATRKTLEANMQMADLYPPGRVFWARRDGDLPHSQGLSSAGSGKEAAKVRLFEVLDTEKVFSQIVFSKNMLSAHLPHRYDQVLHELL